MHVEDYLMIQLKTQTQMRIEDHLMIQLKTQTQTRVETTSRSS